MNFHATPSACSSEQPIARTTCSITSSKVCSSSLKRRTRVTTSRSVRMSSSNAKSTSVSANVFVSEKADGQSAFCEIEIHVNNETGGTNISYKNTDGEKNIPGNSFLIFGSPFVIPSAARNLGIPKSSTCYRSSLRSE